MTTHTVVYLSVVSCFPKEEVAQKFNAPKRGTIRLSILSFYILLSWSFWLKPISGLVRIRVRPQIPVLFRSRDPSPSLCIVKCSYWVWKRIVDYIWESLAISINTQLCHTGWDLRCKWWFLSVCRAYIARWRFVLWRRLWGHGSERKARQTR